MSTSTALSEITWVVSKPLVAVVLLPSGKPTTVPTATPVQAKSLAAYATLLGRTHTDATR